MAWRPQPIHSSASWTPRPSLGCLASASSPFGASLLLPIVPTALAGLGLAGFSTGLLGLYLRIPGMRQNGSLRPTAQGTPLAKDAWLLGIGLSFVLDAILSRGDDTG
jgi:hypothetical protein